MRLNDLQAACAAWAQREHETRGRAWDDLAAEVSRGGVPCTGAELAEWAAEERAAERRSLGRAALPADEEQREWALERDWQAAAETVPGAAEVLGLNRFARNMEELGRGALSPERRQRITDALRTGRPLREEDAEALASHLLTAEAAAPWEVLEKFADFVLPELRQVYYRRVITSVSLPEGWTWEVIETRRRRPGQTKLERSTLLEFDASGRLMKILPRTRPKSSRVVRGGRTASGWRGRSLLVYTLLPDTRADKEGVGARVIQALLEFLPRKYGRPSQVERAKLFGVTRQAISHQAKGLTAKVREATGGRAGFVGQKNTPDPRKGKRLKAD